MHVYEFVNKINLLLFNLSKYFTYLFISRYLASVRYININYINLMLLENRKMFSQFYLVFIFCCQHDAIKFETV